jgi:hypothetical protein
MVLDSLHSNLMEQYQAKPGVLKFLREVRPPARVAIYSLGGSVHWNRISPGIPRLWSRQWSEAAVVAARRKGDRAHSED